MQVMPCPIFTYITVYIRKFWPKVTVDGLTPTRMHAYARNFICCSSNEVHVTHVRARSRSQIVLANTRKRKCMQINAHKLIVTIDA